MYMMYIIWPTHKLYMVHIQYFCGTHTLVYMTMDIWSTYDMYTYNIYIKYDIVYMCCTYGLYMKYIQY
jgi:hypothetical protein